MLLEMVLAAMHFAGQADKNNPTYDADYIERMNAENERIWAEEQNACEEMMRKKYY